MAKKLFYNFGLILQKASFDPKILKKNQPHHVFFKLTGSAISGLAVTMSAADTRFTSIPNIARENHSGRISNFSDFRKTYTIVFAMTQSSSLMTTSLYFQNLEK